MPAPRISEPPRRSGARWLAPALLVALFVGLTTITLGLVQVRMHRGRSAELGREAAASGEHLRGRLAGIGDYIRMLAIDRADGRMDAAIFQQRASQFVADHHELINITWVDSGYVVRDVAPLLGNAQILGLHLDLPEPHRASRAARASHAPVYTRPFEAIQGHASFEVWVPVYRDTEFVGLFAGVYSCQRLLEPLAFTSLSNNCRVRLVDGDGRVLAGWPSKRDVDPSLTRRVTLTTATDGVVLQVEAYGWGPIEWSLLALQLLCLALALGMAYAIYGLWREIEFRIHSEVALDRSRRVHEVIGQVMAVFLTPASDGLHRRLLDAILRGTGSSRGWIGLIRDGGELAVVALADGLSNGALEPDAPLHLAPDAWAAGGWDRALTDRHVCRLEGTAALCWTGERVEHAVAIPLAAGGRPFGLIVIAAPGTGYGDSDVAMLESVGARISPVFDARLQREREEAERERAENQLAIASAYNRSLIEASLDPLVTIDPAGLITDVNAATERVTGYSREELVGTEFPACFTDPAAAREGYQRVFRDGTVRDYSLDLKHRDGGVTPVLYNAAVFRDAEGAVVGVFAAARDVTERRSLESQLRHAQKLEAVGRLAGGIAHDFNNLLMAIMGHAGLAQQGIDAADPVRNDLAQIMAAAERAARLTRSLLAFSRKQHLELKPVELDGIVAGIQELLRRLVTEDIDLRLELSAPGLAVMADAGQIEQVLMNLTTNARDAMPKGGTITIRTGLASLDASHPITSGVPAPDRLAELRFTDTGLGMDETTRQNSFEPFFTTKAVGVGSGLGLAVCYGIVQQHNGHITCTSEPGVGTTFTVQLPLAGRTAVPTAVTAPEPRPRTGHETVLLAEDDEAVRNLTSTILAGAGYTVLVASDGDEAMSKFRERATSIRLCLFDIAMPGTNGVDAYESIRSAWPDTRVLFMTGYAAGPTGIGSRPGAGADIVHKPFGPAELLTRVREALDR